IAQILRNWVSTRQSDWSEHLPSVQLAINTTVNGSTGYSPSQIVYGRNPISVINHAIPTLENPFSKDFIKELQTTQAEVHQNIVKARETQAGYYNKKRKQAPRFNKATKFYSMVETSR